MMSGQDSATHELGKPSTLVEGWSELPSNVDTWAEGQRIGPFRLKRCLGKGGMGLVWLAEQTQPLTRDVAIKVMRGERRGALAEAYFEIERQALAQLSHRSIAQIYDAGRLPDGALFFAMEYVPGVPLDQALREHPITPEALARLLIEVCAGVQHAHQRGLIHRDLKPLNLLVQWVDGAPLPKIIDFGVAISMNGAAPATAVRVAGTGAYMSPEQKHPGPEGIDARTDVYALGVVLAECLYQLAGVDSQRAGADSTQLRQELAMSLGRAEADAGSDRQVLSRLNSVPMELRAVALKAMADEREARYQSASALAEDLQRWLSREPVRAVAGGRGYRLRCFLRRHALASASAAVLLLAISSFAVLATVQAARIAREAERANRALAELETVTEFQAQQLSNIDTAAMGDQLRQAILDQFQAATAERTDAASAQQALEAALAQVNFTDVALSNLDSQIFERAISTINQEFSDRPPLRARLLATVGRTLMDLGLLERSMEPTAEALKIRQAELGPDHPDTLASEDAIGTLLQNQGKLAEAEPHLRAALAGRRRVLGEEHTDTIDSINNLGLLVHLQGRFDEAEPLYLEALDKYRRTLGPNDPSTLQMLNNLGGMLRDQGKIAEAEPYWREALEKRRQQLGDDHPETLMSINNLSALLRDQGNFAASEPLTREAYTRARRVFGEFHPSTLTYLGNLGNLLQSTGQLDEAGELLAAGLAGARKALGDQHTIVAAFASNLGSLRRTQGRLEEAESLWREVLAIRLQALGPSHPGTLLLQSNLSDLLREQQRPQEAVSMLEAALPQARETFVGPLSDRLALLLIRLGRAESALPTPTPYAQAEAHLQEAEKLIQAQEKPLPQDQKLLATAFVEMYERWQKDEPAAAAKAESWRQQIQP
ncbi:MAG: tetratricopeptide repeat protein [Lysobacterales bacterium]